jgi:cation diffusion facilitator family transporter
MLSSARGIWAVKWSFVGLFATAIFQLGVALMSGSVALLADTIHNFGDAATALPLGVAFMLARRRPTHRFTYGYGRAEDLAGVMVILTILFSAVIAGYQSIERFFHPQTVNHVSAVIVASLVGFLGNEAVALFRIKVGREIGSAALVADGQHARIDGLTSLAVLFGAIGVKLGFPIADPVIGLIITVAILQLTWKTSRTVLLHLLDGVEPEIVESLLDEARKVPGVEAVHDARVRWLGHRLHADVNVAVKGELSVTEGHAVAKEVHHRLLHRLPFLSRTMVHVDPHDEAGERFHHAPGHHDDDDLPAHSH